jgi:sensor histidine kinase YesM
MDVSASVAVPTPDATERLRAKSRLYVLFQACGWGGMMAVEIWGMFEFPEHNTWPLASAIAIGSLFFLGGLLITHFFRALMERWGWKELGSRRLLPRLLAAALGMSAVLALFEVALVHPVLDLAWNTEANRVLLVILQIFYGSVVLFGWLCLYLFERLNRSEIERFQLMTSVKEAELRALKSQVNPHFIFNSLNSLRALIDENPARARTAVTQLANLLRYSLQSGQLETVPFEDELGVVNDYLALEQVRHEERLRLRLDIAPDALRLPIPPMLLQTLVENAVKYGISPRADGGEIAIVARNEGGALRIQVSNPGDLSARPATSSTGVGLHNAAERLRLIFGERATLRLLTAKPELVVAEAVIPLPQVS